MLRLFASWAIRRQRKELESFIERLRSLDGADIGFLLAVATDIRAKLEKSGFRMMDPIVDFHCDPLLPTKLNSIVRDFQKRKMMAEAAGAMVWLHTARAGARIELRQLGRDMWKQLQRGFPHVIASSVGARSIDGFALELHGFDAFPAGLTPDPLP
ncbi:MAG: hypothetical protein VX946_06065 [Pseudomonadota bacterium]|nr:hypothetical protein [Pseudomonadota bacterium]